MRFDVDHGVPVGLDASSSRRARATVPALLTTMSGRPHGAVASPRRSGRRRRPTDVAGAMPGPALPGAAGDCAPPRAEQVGDGASDPARGAVTRHAGDTRRRCLPASSRAAPQVRGLEQARLQVGPLAHLAHEGAGDDARLRRASRRGAPGKAARPRSRSLRRWRPGSRHSASAIWCVARSCSVSRLVKQSTSSASRPKPTSLPCGDVRDVRDPPVGQQVVRAHRVEAQAPHHDHVGVGLAHDGIAQDGRRLHLIAGQELRLPELRDARDRSP